MRHPRRSRIAPLLLSAALALPGCVVGRYSGDVEENPVMDTGVGAAVIMPGQSAPVMAPGGGYAPGGSTECQSGPHGQSCTSGGGPVAPSPSAVTMIGGAEQDLENHTRAKEDPLLLKWAAAPFALLAAPFGAAAEAARGEPEPGPAVPQQKTPRPESGTPEAHRDTRRVAAPAGGMPPRAAPDYETQRLQQMEAELDRQLAGQDRGAPTTAPTRAAVARPAPDAARSGARGLSIADELAALQRSPVVPEPHGASAPAPRETHAPGAGPAPRETRAPGATPAPRETHAPGAGPAPRETRAPGATPAPPEAPTPAPGGSPRAEPAAGPARGTTAVADGIVDRDGDGRIDLWIYRRDGEIIRKVLDQNFDGRPDTTLRYDPSTHQLSRVEEDDDHDGVTDGWTDYREGEVVRRRADADRDGLADTWTFYRDGAIHRHEQDTDGDGFRDRVGFYENGRVVREEQDTNADGVADVTSYYDERERVTRREEDKDLDGRIDEINHYENGRLARKELLGAPDSQVP